MTLTAVGQTVTLIDATGTLIASYSITNGVGTISYTYVLADNVNNPLVGGVNQPASVSFGVTVRDADGDPSSGTLVIGITDDAPVAHGDFDSIFSGSHTATGNVLTGMSTDGGTLGRGGYWRARTTRVFTVLDPFGNPVTVNAITGATVSGRFASLIIQSNGSYIYDNSNSDGSGPETFTYRSAMRTARPRRRSW